MASGYQPSLPLSINSLYGPYVLASTFNATAKQNIKMIILTQKGEKLTDIDFGCGLKRYLFESAATFNETALKAEIINQVNEYAPYIQIHNVLTALDEQTLSVQIKYIILPTNTTAEEMFEVTL
jgi:phage baseplate assembly protein W